MTGRPDERFDVFLSHPHTESDVVESIAVKLEDQAHLKVWLDRWVLVPGQHWQQQMAKGLDQAKTCAVCVGGGTPAGWFRQEIERALNRQAHDEKFRVIPVILPNGDRQVIDDFLELRTWVEFKDGVEDPDALHLLLCGVRGVSPGRRAVLKVKEGMQVDLLRQRLSRIRELRVERLIDDEVALEYQRRLLDDLVKTEKQ